MLDSAKEIILKSKDLSKSNHSTLPTGFQLKKTFLIIKKTARTSLKLFYFVHQKWAKKTNTLGYLAA
jgi:hypothetical protein